MKEVISQSAGFAWIANYRSVANIESRPATQLKPENDVSNHPQTKLWVLRLLRLKKIELPTEGHRKTQFDFQLGRVWAEPQLDGYPPLERTYPDSRSRYSAKQPTVLHTTCSLLTPPLLYSNPFPEEPIGVK